MSRSWRAATSLVASRRVAAFGSRSHRPERVEAALERGVGFLRAGGVDHRLHRRIGIIQQLRDGCAARFQIGRSELKA